MECIQGPGGVRSSMLLQMNMSNWRRAEQAVLGRVVGDPTMDKIGGGYLVTIFSQRDKEVPCHLETEPTASHARGHL